jgi:hypothetical protein
MVGLTWMATRDSGCVNLRVIISRSTPGLLIEAVFIYRVAIAGQQPGRVHRGGIVDHRQRATANFEVFVKVVHGKTDPADVYNADTIIDYVCRFIEGYGRLTVGMLGDKVKIGTLYDLKAAIQWSAIALIPGFSAIADVFHTRVSQHIHMTAADLKLSTEVRAKNILTDSELELFFAQIMRKTQRVAGWKQTYVACVLAYITAARPGSFLVTKGYSQGAPMGGAGGAGLHRAESHTLRWKDIEWIRKPNGIAANITFRFAK